jgi:hypothetical protein
MRRVTIVFLFLLSLCYATETGVGVTLEFRLIMASTGGSSQVISTDITDVVSKLKSLFRYDSYRLVGRSQTVCQENQYFNISLGNGYQISGKIELVNAQNGVVRVQGFTLSENRKNIIESALNLRDSDTAIIGSPVASNKAVIVVVVAKISQSQIEPRRYKD